jgi:hypothetical protein
MWAEAVIVPVVAVATEAAIAVIVAVKSACAAVAVATVASIAIPAPLATVAPFAAASAAVINEGDRLVGLECGDSSRRRGAGRRHANRQQRGNRRDLCDLSDHCEIPLSGLHLGLNNAVRGVPAAAAGHAKRAPRLTR